MPERVTAGRPDRSIAIESKTYGSMRLRKAGDAAVGSHMGQRQAPVARPYGTMISGDNAEIVLLCRRKSQSGENGEPKPVEAGIRSHPYAALAIDQHLPYGVGAKSSLGGEALSRSTRRRL